MKIVGKEKTEENIFKKMYSKPKEIVVKLFDFLNRLIEKENNNSNNTENLSEEFLPVNDRYHPTMSSSMEDVENNPRIYIIEECVPACKELWGKNIYTFMVSDHFNEGECWIEIISDNLSDENKEILAQLEGEDIIKFSYHKGCINFGVKCVGKRAQSRLLELAQQFQMQDVPYRKAYITLKEYLVQCGCCDEDENPNYEFMLDPYEMGLVGKDYLKQYEEWKTSDRSRKTLRIYNPSKVTFPIENYFIGTSYVYVEEEGRVYLSDYHYQKHLNYVMYLKSKKLIKNN